MRLFFALELDTRLQHAIDQWRRHSIRCAGRPVPPVNLHITLCFLGEVQSGTVDNLCNEAERIPVGPFRLVLDQCGYFAKPRVFWIGPQEIPAELAALAGKLAGVAGRVGLKQDRRAYRPHVTLMRKCEAAPPLPLTPPDFELECDGFTLFESVSVPGGVRYQPIR